MKWSAEYGTGPFESTQRGQRKNKYDARLLVPQSSSHALSAALAAARPPEVRVRVRAVVRDNPRM